MPDTRYKPREEVLDGAREAVLKSRNADYGPPDQDFTRSADLLTALFKSKLKERERFGASDIAKIMILLKLSRSTWSSKLDNWLDIAGYSACGWECETLVKQRQGANDGQTESISNSQDAALAPEPR